MTLWSAAGISVAAAAVSISGSATTETLSWLAGFCLSGPVCGDVPMLAMENHRTAPAPTVSMGLGFISAALITGGLWPGAPDTQAEGAAAPDPDRILAAMTHVAAATGGISPPELAEQVTRATGIPLSAQEAVLALRSYRDDADEADLSWIADGEGPQARDAIMRAALEVGWTHGEFTPGGLAMVGRLARALGLPGDDLALLFWEVTEPPLHQREDRLAPLRPRSRPIRSAEGTPA
jgi:hypothetical protein